MSEQTPQTKEIEVMKKDTVIDLKLPVDFYFRFNQFMLEFFPFKDGEHFQQILNNIKEGKDNEDAHSYHFRTLLSFLLFVEEEARKQGHIEKINIDIETGDKV